MLSRAGTLEYKYFPFHRQVSSRGHAAVHRLHNPDSAAGQMAFHRGQDARSLDPGVDTGQLRDHISLAAQAYGAAYDS